MHCGLYLPNFGEHARPETLVGLARDAEAAGWDGFFLRDHIQRSGRRPVPGAFTVDPWVALAAVAMATERMRLGPLVTPLARRRPWKVAREVVTLDHLSGGRVVFGVGLGAPPEAEFTAFGESADPRVRAARLDEGLAVIDGLWSGEPFHHHGEHYALEGVQFAPRPLQQPRVPIWVAGIWPSRRPFERAARWDGAFPLTKSEPAVSAEQVADIVAFARQRRPEAAAFDVVAGGDRSDESPEAKSTRRHRSQEAGATWWLEWVGVKGMSYEQTRDRVRQGPPRN